MVDCQFDSVYARSRTLHFSTQFQKNVQLHMALFSRSKTLDDDNAIQVSTRAQCVYSIEMTQDPIRSSRSVQKLQIQSIIKDF
jgi:hypothetical protein